MSFEHVCDHNNLLSNLISNKNETSDKPAATNIVNEYLFAFQQERGK